MVFVKPLSNRVTAAIFDLDGTLVETNIDFPLMKSEMIALALEQGLDRQMVESLDILAIVDVACGSALVTSRQAAGQLRSRALARLEEIELSHARSTTDIPFARELVSSLKTQGIGVGIVTRNCRKASLISLEMARIAPDVLVTRDDTQKHKPHPEPLLKALAELSASEATSVMVGDHTMDVECGKNAGVRTIGLLREDRPRDFFDQIGPDFVAINLEEVLYEIVNRNC